MNKFVVIFGVLLSFCTNARADVCYDIDDNAANKAVEIIRNQKEIYKYCSICPDAAPETIIVHKAQNKELFLLSIFDENDYLRENEEFLKFSSGIYRFLNHILPQHSFLRMKIKSWYKKMKNRRKERI